MDKSRADELSKLSPEEVSLKQQNMLRALLADRFQLTLHRETKDLPIYALVIAKNGLKLHEAKPDDTYPNGIKGPDGRALKGAHLMRMGRGELTGQALATDELVRLLSQQLGRTVLDKTGLKGNYDFTLKWTPDDSEAPMLKGPAGGPPSGGNAAPPESSGTSIFTAIQEQLGLKLESQKGPVEVLVIDHVEKPSEN